MADTILFVGDIHDKAGKICPAVEHHIAAHDVDTVVLLGDLLNDWNMSAKGEVNEFTVLHGHVLDWRRRGVNVRPLVGNHDVIYLFPPRSGERPTDCAQSAPATGRPRTRPSAPMLLELRPQLAYGTPLTDGQSLCTHAGITNDWLEWCDGVLDTRPKDTTAADIADWLNQLFRNHPMTFMERVGTARGGGYRHDVSPLWADKTETEREPRPHDITQIVGHTPVETVTREHGIWFCDTMSDDNHYNHLGDGSMLLYDKQTGGFTTLEWPDEYDRSA